MQPDARFLRNTTERDDVEPHNQTRQPIGEDLTSNDVDAFAVVFPRSTAVLGHTEAQQFNERWPW